MSGSFKLKLSENYDLQQARHYLSEPRDGLIRRLAHLRDEQVARKALRLAGDPGLVLDLPCGAGKFWPVLAEKPTRIIIGGDHSVDMLDSARTCQDPDIVKRVVPLHTSALDIDLPDGAVDCVFSMRLLQQMGDAQQRLDMLREFHRVSRESVILSTRCDPATGQDSASVEQAFDAAGFSILRCLTPLPLYSSWRVYVLLKR